MPGGGECPRPRYPWQAAFTPSTGASVQDRLGLVQLSAVTVRKGLLTNGRACRNTLAVYAEMRRVNCEEEVPLLFLYRVKRRGMYTFVWQGYMGDYGSKSGFTVAEFLFFKRRSVAVLASKGIDTATIPPGMNNWVAAPARAGGGARVAYAIDMGGMRLLGV